MTNDPTIDDLIQQVDMDNKRIVELEKKIDDLIKWREKDRGAAPMLDRRTSELEKRTVLLEKKIEDDTLTPEWGGCVYAKIGEIEEKLLAPLSKNPPSQDCATYYQSLENQVKQLVADQECLNTNTNKTLETSLLPQDMMKRLQEMEKKIFTYKELQARGIGLKKEEENEGV